MMASARLASGGEEMIMMKEEDDSSAKVESEAQAQSPAEPSGQALEAEEIREDFMTNVNLNTRNYSHPKQPSIFRQDFTQTIYFETAKLLTGGFNFTLPSQVSNFIIRANVFTNQGKYATITKTIQSELPVFISMATPKQILTNERLEVPVSVRTADQSKLTGEYELVFMEQINNQTVKKST